MSHHKLKKMDEAKNQPCNTARSILDQKNTIFNAIISGPAKLVRKSKDKE